MRSPAEVGAAAPPESRPGGMHAAAPVLTHEERAAAVRDVVDQLLRDARRCEARLRELGLGESPGEFVVTITVPVDTLQALRCAVVASTVCGTWADIVRARGFAAVAYAGPRPASPPTWTGD